jgi:hypothetical protein
MGLLPMLLGLIFPACASEGAAGLPVPALMELARIERPATPNTALAAPAGFGPTPDRVTVIKADPDRLYAAVKRVALGQERTFLHVAFDSQRQLHVVVRSAAANFPDLVMLAVTSEGGLVLWSRSVYGRKDFGVNAARVDAWIDLIAAELARN